MFFPPPIDLTLPPPPSLSLPRVFTSKNPLHFICDPLLTPQPPPDFLPLAPPSAWPGSFFLSPLSFDLSSRDLTPVVRTPSLCRPSPRLIKTHMPHAFLPSPTDAFTSPASSLVFPPGPVPACSGIPLPLTFPLPGLHSPDQKIAPPSCRGVPLGITHPLSPPPSFFYRYFQQFSFFFRIFPV